MELAKIIYTILLVLVIVPFYVGIDWVLENHLFDYSMLIAGAIMGIFALFFKDNTPKDQ